MKLTSTKKGTLIIMWLLGNLEVVRANGKEEGKDYHGESNSTWVVY